MATHFLPLSKNMSCTSTPQGKHLCQISWELVKNWGSSSRRKIFPQFFAIICRYPWQHTFYHCQKMCLAHLHPQGKHLCQISWELVKNWGSSSWRKIFPPIFAIICRYHGNTLSTNCHKNVSCTSTPQGKHLCQISWELVKNWGSSSRRKIFSHFCHNMPLPWQHTFYHCQKNMSCTSTPPRQTSCAKFHENWWKTEEVVRDARFSPPFLP